MKVGPGEADGAGPWVGEGSTRGPRSEAAEGCGAGPRQAASALLDAWVLYLRPGEGEGRKEGAAALARAPTLMVPSMASPGSWVLGGGWLGPGRRGPRRGRGWVGGSRMPGFWVRGPRTPGFSVGTGGGWGPDAWVLGVWVGPGRPWCVCVCVTNTDTWVWCGLGVCVYVTWTPGFRMCVWVGVECVYV